MVHSKVYWKTTDYQETIFFHQDPDQKIHTFHGPLLVEGQKTKETQMNFELQMADMIKSSLFTLSDIEPSKWAEKYRTMGAGSAFPGPFDYRKTPYLVEIVDCLSPFHPAKEISVMKAAQIGFTTGVIESGIGWIIAENPGPILFMTGHGDLSEEAMNKIDSMIDNTGLRPLIHANTLRKKNQRTGDTNKSKEFPGGNLISGAATNHKLFRQRSVKYGFFDDYDAARTTSSDDGSLRELIKQRFAAYYDQMKIFYISTPQKKYKSNIDEAFQLGDQREWFVPCPHCGTLITLKWSVDIKDSNEKAGIFYRLDGKNRLIKDSVGYVCQECANFFTDQHKYELNLHGKWMPQVEPIQDDHFSYHINSLNAPHGMFDWKYYVEQYLEANPYQGQRNEKKHQTFQNLVLGEPYEEVGEQVKANALQMNIRAYEVGTVPEKMSIQDGNGKIVLLTLACDLNGIVEDARLDWEILAWSESGASYSVKHGSIGTFIPLEGTKKFKVDRARWSYEFAAKNSVWPVLQEIIRTPIQVDTGRKMGILISLVDTGHYTLQAYTFIENTTSVVFGIKGDKDKPLRLGTSHSIFTASQEKPGKLFLLQVNHIKDDLAQLIKLRWDPGNDDRQPPGFMNYPTPSGGLYSYKDYFSHYEAETRIVSEEGVSAKAIWKKKNAIVQNHFWDVRVYNMAAKEIITFLVCREAKIKNHSWQDFVALFKNQLF